MMDNIPLNDVVHLDADGVWLRPHVIMNEIFKVPEQSRLFYC